MAFKMKNPFKQLPAMPFGASLIGGLEQYNNPTKKERDAIILRQNKEKEALALKKENEKTITLNTKKEKKNLKVKQDNSGGNFA
tara:strand:- start:396 stop:647 length:252 start_codon:yes stop_codon:yes gene_type:complete